MAEAAPSERLYITGLPEGYDDAAFTAVFAQYGTVVGVKVLANNKPGQPVAGICQMATVEEAKWMLENLNGGIPQGLGVPVTVKYAISRDDRGKGKGKDKGYQPYGNADAWNWGGGWSGASWSAAWDGANNGGKGKGRSGSIEDVLKGLQASGALPYLDTALQPNVCLHVGGLPPDSADVDLYKIFAPFGAVQSVNISVDWSSGDGVVYGVVNYFHEHSVSMAIAALNGATLPSGSMLTVIHK